MKRLMILAVVAAMLLCCTACGEEKKDTVDLTALSSTMVYSEVYNMLSNPGEYMGKTVKMQGTMSVFEDSNTGNVYYACIIADATACCSQGLEFLLAEGDYPEAGAEITVTGTFGTYFEGETQYCRLSDAKLVV